MTTTATNELHAYRFDTLINGREATVPCMDIQAQRYALTPGIISILKLEDEWYEDIADPVAVITELRENFGWKPDLFTFWQRPPENEVNHPFHIEWEEIAILPIQSYEHWFNRQIKSRVRNQIRKAEREGVIVLETTYDDEFVRGMTAIFNESPVRQGRRFWHYGKDFETVKRQFSRNIHREEMIAAWYKDEMIGLIMLGNAGRFALTGQIISAIRHRDKATNNLLIAKAVEVCARKGVPYLCYLFWSGDSLAEFKRRCGFECMRVPRYYIPLTTKGRVALNLGLHRGWKVLLPDRLKQSLKQLRTRLLTARSAV